MDAKERYLSNPHLKLDHKLKKQLGIETEDVAGTIETPVIDTNKEVIINTKVKKNGRRKKKFN